MIVSTQKYVVTTSVYICSFFFSSRRRHTRSLRDWSSDVCSSDLLIDKAIRSSDLGLNPTNDGKVVRVPMPSPTQERRKELVKQLHKILENHRTAVRNIRRDIKEAIDKLEKDKKISQDEQKRALEEMEKFTHAETKKIEDLSAAKEKEIMEIK